MSRGYPALPDVFLHAPSIALAWVAVSTAAAGHGDDLLTWLNRDHAAAWQWSQLPILASLVLSGRSAGQTSSDTLCCVHRAVGYIGDLHGVTGRAVLHVLARCTA